MDRRTRGWAARAMRRAMHLGGARQMAVYRQERDANGAAIGEARRVGCVYGLRVDEAQSVRVHIALPGIVAAREMRGYLCALGGCAACVAVGDLIEDGGKRYEIVDAVVQAGAVLRLTVREGGVDLAGAD